MKLWDWAALVPVVEGAGGRVTDWSGAQLRPDSDGTVLAVGDPALLAPAVALLNDLSVAPAAPAVRLPGRSAEVEGRWWVG